MIRAAYISDAAVLGQFIAARLHLNENVGPDPQTAPRVVKPRHSRTVRSKKVVNTSQLESTHGETVSTGPDDDGGVQPPP